MWPILRVATGVGAIVKKRFLAFVTTATRILCFTNVTFRGVNRIIWVYPVSSFSSALSPDSSLAGRCGDTETGGAMFHAPA